MPVAYSYIRFSSPQQAKGDSLRRQTEARERWLKDHPDVTLDTSEKMSDEGRSGFRRKNWDTYALARFVERVKAGHIKKGSYLLVENLDRLSREEAGEAVELFLSIVNNGVTIVQLLPVVMEFKKPVNTMQLMFAIVELSRGHSESAMKSERHLKNWERKRSNADKVPMTLRCPGWIRGEMVEGKRVFHLIPERVEIVRRIYQMAYDGMGATKIAQTLNDEGVPVFEGTQVKRKHPQRWTEVSTYNILTTRTVLGEFQPCKRVAGAPNRGRVAQGEPRRNYFPAAVDESLFYAVQRALDQRRTKGKGRWGKHVNLFSGLLEDARSGRSLTYRHHTGRQPFLVPVGAKHKSTDPGGNFNAVVFERAILSMLKEVKPSDIWSDGGTVSRVEGLQAELSEVDRLIESWTAKMDNLDIVDLVASKLSELKAKRKSLTNEIDSTRREATNPKTQSWGEFQGLAQMMENEPTDELKLKVRSALRRTIDGIHCLFNSRRGTAPRYAVVQVNFTEDEQGKQTFRQYFIEFQPAGVFGKERKPGSWRVRSWTDAQLRQACMPAQFDLRHKDPTALGEDDEGNMVWVSGWSDVERDLGTVDLELVFAGCERHILT